MAAEAGKGSAPRKKQDQEAYTENYSKIFGQNSWLERKKKQEEAEKRYKCLNCVHLKEGKYDLLECTLKQAVYPEGEKYWYMKEVCKHDADAAIDCQLPDLFVPK